MRRALVTTAAAGLLGGPTVLAFFSGGYYTAPRLAAGIAAWALVLGLCLTGPLAVPRGGPARAALAGLALLTAWTVASIAWAPLGGPAVEAAQRLLLYLGAFVLALLTLRTPRALRAVEPALAAGATVVIGYGLSGRLLPGLIELSRSTSAQGRLEQPITYWNSEGALAALGLVLCARLAGDPTRSLAVRRLAAGAVVPLAAGVGLSLSRGAIAVALVGVVVLMALMPTRPQLRAGVAALVLGVLAAGIATAFDGVATLEGSLATRIRDGALAGGLLFALAAAAAALTGRDRGEHDAELRLGARVRAAAAGGAVLVTATALLLGGLSERPTAAELSAGANAKRLTTVSSNRYEYWRVGLEAFAREPLRGTGAGAFRVEWLRERTIAESVRDAHSLLVEVAAELGVVGLLALALLLLGTAWAARRALGRSRAAAAGPAAAALAWALHAAIDWDWQLPAVALPALIMAAALVVLDEPARPIPTNGHGA